MVKSYIAFRHGDVKEFSVEILKFELIATRVRSDYFI